MHGVLSGTKSFHVLYYKLKNKLFYFIFFTDLGRNYKNYKETPEKGGRLNWLKIAPKNKSVHEKEK